jgi:hypothetical protein
MEITIIEPSEVIISGETKGRKYGKYAQAIGPEVQWIKDAITKSNDGKIRIKIREIARSMGPEFEKKQDKAIYWGTRFVLFHDGIVVAPGKDKDNEELLVMRMATSEDMLPPSLAKFLEPCEDDMPEPGVEES